MHGLGQKLVGRIGKAKLKEKTLESFSSSGFESGAGDEGWAQPLSSLSSWKLSPVFVSVCVFVCVNMWMVERQNFAKTLESFFPSLLVWI